MKSPVAAIRGDTLRPRRVVRAVCLAVCVLAVTFAARAAEEPWIGSVPDRDARELVTAFVKADAWGLLTGDHWSLVQQFADWADAPGYDVAEVVESARIVSWREAGGKVRITVRYKVLGELNADGEGMPNWDTTNARVVTHMFDLRDLSVGRGEGESRWRIVESQAAPRISAGYALKVLLPQWCGKRDCGKTVAFRQLSRYQRACAVSPIPVNRDCDRRALPRGKR